MQINSTITYSFSGLTKNLKKTAYHKYSNMKSIQDLYSNSLAGNLPYDLIKLAKGNDIKNLISKIEDACIELRKIEDLIYDSIDNLNVDKYVQNYKQYVYKNNSSLDYVDKSLAFTCSSFADKDIVDIVAKSASEKLKKALNAYDVSVKFLSEGSFGYVFSLSCKDNEGRKLMHDKVIKIYKQSTSHSNLLDFLYEKIKKSEQSSYFKFHLLTQIANRKKVIDSADREFVKSTHGILAETNRALFIKDKCKYIKNSNFIEPFLFDINSGFGVFEKADDELPDIKKEFDLSSYGLYHSDSFSQKNTSYSRIIDYGGISY